ncbi:MAG: DUF4373 domain-containing protein [Eubacterium sp.]|nr:DUF4373 domain-containing protein [Eubacterium sp.]
MARPIKTGLDYFELDCQLEEKVRLIQAEFGLKGFAIVVKLYQRIYGGFGYYCEWNADSSLLFMSDNGVSSREEKNLIEEIVSACIRRNIFSKELYEKFGILTSEGVQKRYLNATVRREKVEMKKEYLLVSVGKNNNNVCINSDNVDRNSDNVDRNTQSREEKSREEKSIYIGAPHYFDNEELNQAFCTYLNCRKNKGDEVKGQQIALLIQQLDVLSSDVKEQIQIINKATMSNWKSFYPLKSDQKKRKASFSQREYDYDDMEKKLMAGRDKKMQQRKEQENGEVD